MSWNYRVCRYRKNGETLFGIREVYYDARGRIKGLTDASVDDWETHTDLKGTLTLMAKALDRPLLDEERLLTRLAGR